MPVPACTKLGSYQVTARIGAGGMGDVYQAHETNLGRDAAIKVLPESFALQNAEALEAAHGKGTIHRDLKPANWKLTPQGKVKVFKETEDE